LKAGFFTADYLATGVPKTWARKIGENKMKIRGL
jgi:hypothetical protein